MSILGVAQASARTDQARVCCGLWDLSSHHSVILVHCMVHLHMQAFNVSVKASQSSSFIGGLGRLLDKGINRLISGDLPPSGPPSGGSEQADLYGRQHSRNSDSGSPSVGTPEAYFVSPFVVVTAMGVQSMPCTMAALGCHGLHIIILLSGRGILDIQSCVQHRRTSSAQHNGGLTPVASFKDLASASQLAFAQGGAHSSPSQQVRPPGIPAKPVH